MTWSTPAVLVAWCAVALLLASQHAASAIEVPENYALQSKHSFKSPIFMVRGQYIPFWKFGDDAVVTEEYVRLTPDQQSRKGWLWNTLPVQFGNWEVLIEFRSWSKRVGADGFVFWYAQEPGVSGPVFGSRDRWTGLGLFFDTFDNDGKGNNPEVYAIVNDGSRSFEGNADGGPAKLGQCTSYFRGNRNARAKVQYLNGTLRVSIDPSGKGDRFTDCFQAPVDLPTGFHFGLSAATGDLADAHDIFAVQTWMVGPAGSQAAPEEQPPSSDGEFLEQMHQRRRGNLPVQQQLDQLQQQQQQRQQQQQQQQQEDKPNPWAHDEEAERRAEQQRQQDDASQHPPQQQQQKQQPAEDGSLGKVLEELTQRLKNLESKPPTPSAAVPPPPPPTPAQQQQQQQPPVPPFGGDSGGGFAAETVRMVLGEIQALRQEHSAMASQLRMTQEAALDIMRRISDLGAALSSGAAAGGGNNNGGGGGGGSNVNTLSALAITKDEIMREVGSLRQENRQNVEALLRRGGGGGGGGGGGNEQALETIRTELQSIHPRLETMYRALEPMRTVQSLVENNVATQNTISRRLSTLADDVARAVNGGGSGGSGLMGWIYFAVAQVVILAAFYLFMRRRSGGRMNLPYRD